jgi:hypothetical protein
VYPEGVNVCRTLDLLSMSMMKREAFMDVWPRPEALQMLNTYIQPEEKEAYDFIENWKATEVSASTLNDLFR